MNVQKINNNNPNKIDREKMKQIDDAINVNEIKKIKKG
jgi:hypothetical protein